MRKLLTLGKWKTLSLSMQQIRMLMWCLTIAVGGLVLMVIAVVVQQKVDHSVAQLAATFGQQSQEAARRVDIARQQAGNLASMLEHLSDLDHGGQPRDVEARRLIENLRDGGDGQYQALPAYPDGGATAGPTETGTLSTLLSFCWRINGAQYRDLRNAYIVGLRSDQFYVIPRRQGEAQVHLSDDAWRQRYASQILARVRSTAILQALYADPDSVIMLEPMVDPLSGKPVVTLVALVQRHDIPVALLAIDVPVSTFLADQHLLPGFGMVLPDGKGTLSDSETLDPVLQRITERAVQAVNIDNDGTWVWLGRLHWSVLFKRTEGDLQTQAALPASLIWSNLRSSVLLLLGLGLSGIGLMVVWIMQIDRRILRPTLRQSALMQESEAFNRGVVQIAPVSLMIAQRDNGKILKRNVLARKLADDAAEGEVQRLIGLCQAAAPSVDSQNETVQFEVELACMQGEPRYLEVRLVASIYQGMAALLITLNDCTVARNSEIQLKQAVAAAAEANRAKSAFLATMSHEIRTPLNGMLGGIELLDMTELDAQQRSRLDVLKRSSDSLLNTINDVLDFSKIEAGQMVIRPQPCNLVDLVEGVARNFGEIALAKGIEFYCVIDPLFRGEIMIDGARLEQILNNLVGNALKFTERGKVVINVASVMENHVPRLEIKVLDTGIGISPEDQKRLFTPFVQVEQSDSRRYGGTGLGLSICKRLLALMDGEIHLMSEAGFGSCFRLSLPYDELHGSLDHDVPMQLRGITVRLALALPEMKADVERWLRWHHAQVIDAGSPYKGNAILLTDTHLASQHPAANIVLAPGVMPGPAPRAATVSWLNRNGLILAVMKAAGRAPRQAEALQAPQRRAARRQLRVLLVEDHPVNQIVMQGQLEALGQMVDLAGDGLVALEQIHQAAYDLIITDIQMPRMDGYTLVRALRAQGITVPIIAITANVYRDEQERCRAAGVDYFLTKPVQTEALRALLDQMPAASGATVSAPAKPSNVLPWELMVRSLEADIATLQQAFVAKDKVAMQQRLHALAGALAVVGYDAHSRQCRSLEKKLAQQAMDSPGFNACWLTLQSRLQDLLSRMRAEASITST
ncbi:hybrid sensor histidine kinase/response regulator [Silvimonas soli]|uniref:hybrid sensor histidine kinase/response regulator n=1 Tax=Silvimonas soli TaxID=2980100 RepID=UPI0024B37C73|nr:hybrid sensor histidine kinase/response regulator [Silvimonas soli]